MCVCVCVCVCVLIMEGIKSERGYRFEKAFVSVTQHTVPHASECAYPGTTGNPQPASMLTEVLYKCNTHIHTRVGHRMPQP